MSARQKFPRAAALDVARELVRVLKPCCEPERLIVAGSLRRMKDEVGDVEIVFVPKTGTVQDGLFEKEGDLAEAALDELLARGVLRKRTNSQGSEMWGAQNKLALHVASGIPVDLFSIRGDRFFNYLVCRTGSAQMNTLIASKAIERGLKWMPYHGGFEITDIAKVLDALGHTDGILPPHIRLGALIPVKSERAVFDIVGLGWREPRER
jgi:DNA polymerase/3'-5' exonuclease PolX